MTKRQTNVVTILSITVLALALLNSQRLWFRLDLTKNKAYTISPASRNLYNEIPDQVRITYYVSDRLASVVPLPGEITDLLREYAAYSRGRIRLTVRDPVKANLEEEVERLGIQGQQIEIVERDEAGFATVYTGILIEYLDRTEVLPVVFSLETLEYDLTSRIRSLVRGVEREAGVVVGDAGKQWPNDYQYLDRAFAQAGFRVRVIGAGEEIADTLPALFVLGGMEDMDDWALYRIDRYVQGGGKVLFALEGVYVDTRTGNITVRELNDRGLLAMVASYGAQVKPALVLDRTAQTLSYQTGGQGGFVEYRMVRYPHWIGITGQNGNSEHPISSGFAGADLFWSSPVELNPPAGIEGTVLFTSTPEAWLQTKDFQVNPDMSFAFMQEMEETQGAKVLAAALAGKFPSWFADKDKPVREGSSEELPEPAGAAEDARIVVIGDTDIASLMFTRNYQPNLTFLIKAADWLCNDDDIIGIRNRSVLTGRLEKIVDPEKRIAAMSFARALNVVVVPLTVIAAGLLIAVRRRRAVKEDASATTGRANDDV
ncbi:MAG: GldG family protein [Spirochaetaceae bacterium]|jgi:gliding-associated putative ABC transporter substrate-binding component GldG|nr:GldG family protein [Spirochaetaceae bacterium]